MGDFLLSTLAEPSLLILRFYPYTRAYLDIHFLFCMVSLFTFLRRFSYKVLIGSFIIASGWGWYHLSKHNIPVLIASIVGIALGVALAFVIGVCIVEWLLRRFDRHPFWQRELVAQLDGLYVVASLLFVIFFFRSEFASVVYVLLWIPLVFWYVGRIFRAHPEAHSWQRVHRVIGVAVWGVCALQALFQLVAYHYYILDSNIKFFNIVLFRTVAMTGFWLAGFSVAAWLYWFLPRGFRLIAGVVWSALFIFSIAFWATNIGILYYSGLYLSPSALDHAQGSAGVVENTLSLVLALGALGAIGLCLYGLYAIRNVHRTTPRRVWQVYTACLIIFGVGACLTLSSFKNTPERQVIKSFYTRYAGNEVVVSLPSELQKKLERFGLFYHPEQFLVTEHSQIFDAKDCGVGVVSSTKNGVCKPLLSSISPKKKPNLVVIFLESYSARLTGPYNSRFKEVTPGLNAMAADPDTTLFKNYYNASTPTITGIISALCSFLPPTGHNEIQNDRKLQSHRLQCLPEMLKKYAGFTYTNYITAVDKEFAHKDGIFTSMGVDKVYGTKELASVIAGEPLSWGYSDHQLFPALARFMNNEATNQPFFMALSTVDTHPPFNLAKDEVPYGDGKQQVLNAFHTTDDAFLKFWQEFRSSTFASNTILVAVADHAIFPAALTKDLFPAEASSLTYYDENTLLMYVPDSVLPQVVTTTASGIDFAPTLLHLYGVNVTNTFEGHSIFADRGKYPNLVGMHELGLYINQMLPNGKREVRYDVPDALECPTTLTVSSTAPLSLCELKRLYQWKRQMFEEGRLWKP